MSKYIIYKGQKYKLLETERVDVDYDSEEYKRGRDFIYKDDLKKMGELYKGKIVQKSTISHIAQYGYGCYVNILPQVVLISEFSLRGKTISVIGNGYNPNSNAIRKQHVVVNTKKISEEIKISYEQWKNDPEYRNNILKRFNGKKLLLLFSL